MKWHKMGENLGQGINIALFWASLYLLFGFNSEGRDLETELLIQYYAQE